MGLFDSILNSAKTSLESSIKGSVKHTVNSAKKGIEQGAAKAVTKAFTDKKKTFTYNVIPANVGELKVLKEADMKDPFGVVALTILAINVLADNREAGMEMLEFLNGPADVCPRDKQFIHDRFDEGSNYIARSYFKGALPKNNYTPEKPYTIEVEEHAHSKDNLDEGYMKLAVRSGGADSERYVVLRTKPSTGEWFLWEFSGLFVGVRIPVEQDAWA